MSREIRFRAWTSFKTMVNVPTVNFATNEAVMPDGEWYKTKYLMQFTGLLDKNGTEIYEGDIVEWEEHKDAPHIMEVVAVMGGWDLSKADGKYIAHLGCNGKFFAGQLKVIGNIYENPELLEANQ